MAQEGLRSYLKGSVPISVGLHLLVLFLVFVIPLTANLVLPVVTVELPEYVRVAPMPPPPEVVPAARRTLEAVAPTPTVPTSAPPSVGVETPQPVYAPPGPPDAVTGFPSSDIGFGTREDAPRVVQPPPLPKTSGPVRIADLPVPPRKTVDVRPVYPEIARQVKREGTVVMEAVLDTTGRVTQLRVIQSVPLLDQAAMDAVRQWRYTPTTLGGQPVSVLMTITIRFTLQQ